MRTLLTVDDLTRDLFALGIGAKDIVLVHAGLRSIGPMIAGPDTLIAALRQVVGPEGTIMAYADWQGAPEAACDEEGHILREWRDHVLPFDPAASRAIRDNGAFPEFLRTTLGALRSVSPGPSMVALGAKAKWLLDPHPLDYGYGPGTPLARLVEAGGKVAMIGAPWETMTLLHHAEHLADIPGKRVVRWDVPFLEDGQTVWRTVEEFDTGNPAVEGLDDDYFDEVVRDFVATGQGSQGTIGAASALLVDAPAMTRFAVDWLESRFGP
ncbi:aminoglycoside 3-N-acetyltransferase [Blastomonas natatoria]|uniref:Aminoglycoside N(3)-acetyltransferase n=1 Tax=Blastomonas natatoria TaxID=34015 RepID=A0A2V3V1X2_9SPHN|nr:aminoglycoside 3-N-acetyltransferase [Blastomonas natatoria]PXW75064.1 aminoglycoside 3-N-acetyltransferase [Blastomonas natatoria]